jgi:hypothetical protein
MALQEDLVQRVDALISKGERVCRAEVPYPPGHSGVRKLQTERFSEWQSQSESFLVSILGESHTYVSSFRQRVRQAFVHDAEVGQGILRAVREDLESGYLKKITTLVEAEIFSDFLEMARHLHSAGYKDPAASLTGGILEDGLRKIATAHNIQLNPKETINTLNEKCRTAVYNQLVWRRVQTWGDIRNYADHGHYNEYSADDVAEMIEGIEGFLSQYLK